MGRSYVAREAIDPQTSGAAALIASPVHCHFCFEVLHSHLRDGIRLTTTPPFPDAFCPLFVTWTGALNGSHHHKGPLRGCIGTLEPRQLHSALRDYALTSALRDSRFAPIALSELSSLCCTVSLLSQFEDAADWNDWTLGVHGLIIAFTDPEQGCRRTATFLPDVAPEQGWDKQQTIDALVRKAGCSRAPTPVLRRSLHVTRYQSTLASATFDDYLRAMAPLSTSRTAASCRSDALAADGLEEAAQLGASPEESILVGA